jgi:hypothetical protein
MEAPETSSTVFYIGVTLFVVLAVWLATWVVVSRMNTVPLNVSGFTGNANKEGFQGPTRGVSSFPCGQESAEASALVDIFEGRASTTESGEPDLTELKAILSKMCCMKHDLMGVSQTVQASLYLPYNNAHDRENPADTVGRCFTKGIPPRDLDITFATWKDRALLLINRLCTSYSLSVGETDDAKKYFMRAWNDCYDVAQTVCLVENKVPTSSPRDPKGFLPEAVQELGEYKGYY